MPRFRLLLAPICSVFLWCAGLWPLPATPYYTPPSSIRWPEPRPFVCSSEHAFPRSSPLGEATPMVGGGL
uniref:Putative secreted protein n=1 Tax=Anopheles darlingi TaxID=43151 RepID=A0A2M4DLT2_ANODA